MPKRNVWYECLHFASYYAPRGRPRLMTLGNMIGQRYLTPEDQLIGIMGEPGSGKSSVISGMFPGLELTNDDERVNVRPVPLMREYHQEKFTSYSYHIDVQFESGFEQPYEIANAVREALKQDKRVIVEHFDKLYKILNINAGCLIGIGEEIVVCRPNILGPFPEDIMEKIKGTAIRRKMAHSAEDITSMILERDYGYQPSKAHSDVTHGFVIEFDNEPENIDLDDVEKKVLNIINKNVAISQMDEKHISIGGKAFPCTGPRIHVKESMDIKNFHLEKKIFYNEINNMYCIVGKVDS